MNRLNQRFVRLFFFDLKIKVWTSFVDSKSYEKRIIITTLVTFCTNILLQNFVCCKANRWFWSNNWSWHDRWILLRTMEFAYYLFLLVEFRSSSTVHSWQMKRMNRTTFNIRFRYFSRCVYKSCYDLLWTNHRIYDCSSQ
jgi:hypothetical protein